MLVSPMLYRPIPGRPRLLKVGQLHLTRFRPPDAYAAPVRNTCSPQASEHPGQMRCQGLWWESFNESPVIGNDRLDWSAGA
jgi:hypothetical protein